MLVSLAPQLQNWSQQFQLLFFVQTTALLLSERQSLQTLKNALSGSALYSLIDVFGEPENGGIVNLWHFGQKCREFFLVFGQNCTKAYLCLSVECQQIEVFSEISSKHFQIGRVVDTSSVNTLFKDAVQYLEIDSFGGFVLLHQIFDDLHSHLEVRV